MIFQWYTGGDKTNEVARKISSFHSRQDLPQAQRLELLQEALAKETDPNWRGYLLTWIGYTYNLIERDNLATNSYLMAVGEYNPFERNFRDVAGEYCRAHLALTYQVYADPKESISRAVSSCSALAFMDMTDLTNDEQREVFAWLSRAFSTLGYQTGQTLFHHLALPLALRAHRLDSDDPEILQQLVYCYFNLKNPVACRRVFEAFMDVCGPGQAREELVAFMSERFSEIEGDRA